MPEVDRPHEFVPPITEEIFVAGLFLVPENGGTVPEETGLGFTPQEEVFLNAVSLGSTSRQLARQFRISHKQVLRAQDNISGRLGVPNMPAAVNMSILREALPVTIEPKPEIVDQLSRRQIILLKFYSVGVTSQAIANTIGRPVNEVANYDKELFPIIKAKNRTHSVRRAYELGVLKRSAQDCPPG